MRAENFDIEDVIQNLQGTCGHPISSCFGEDGILNDDYTPKYPDMDEDDLTEDDYMELDNWIFVCESCGWWCGTSEDNDFEGQRYCDDCYSEAAYDE